MLDQILTTTLSNGLPLEINFSAGRGQEEDAVLLVADIADHPEYSYEFRMQEPDWLRSLPEIDPEWAEED